MNKVLRIALMVCLVAGALSAGAALAQAPITGLVLVGDLPKDAEIVEDKSDADGNYLQVLVTSDGAFSLATIRQRVSGEYPMEMPVADLLSKVFECEDLPKLEAVEVEPIAAYPTERVRFEMGKNEDASVEDVVVIRTDEYYFVFLAHTSLDNYAGMTDGYGEGDAARMIDIWVESLNLFDPAETTGGE
jgi:hypothetical protein